MTRWVCVACYELRPEIFYVPEELFKRMLAGLRPRPVGKCPVYTFEGREWTVLLHCNQDPPERLRLYPEDLKDQQGAA